MTNLTDQEKAVLDFIIQYRAENRCNPTHVLIAEIIPPIKREKLGRQSATAIIKTLKEKGYLEPTGRFGDYVIADKALVIHI